MPYWRKDRYGRRTLYSPIFSNRYVGRKTVNVRGKGQAGQPIYLAGTDMWTGGVGPTTNNEIFGGESTGGSWTDYISKGFLLVGSRQLIIGASGDNSETQTAKVTHNSSGTQNIDGNITCKFWAKTIRTLGADGWFEMSLRSAGGTDSARWYSTGNLTEWKPYIKNGANNEAGSTYNVVDGEWHTWKIIIKAATTEFYIDDELKETLSQANAQPNDSAVSAYIMAMTSSAPSNPHYLRVRRVWAQYGST